MNKIVWLSSFVFASALWVMPLVASADTVPTYSVRLSYDNASHELAAVVTEAQTSPNACDLVLTRMEYMEDVKLMNVELAADFCPMEIIGNRKGVVTWQVPRSLRQGGEFSLRVNGKVLGKVVINGSAGAARLRLRK